MNTYESKSPSPGSISGYATRLFIFICTSILFSGCATYPGWLNSSGASREQVQDKNEYRGLEGVQLIVVNNVLTRKLLASRKKSLFSESFISSAQSAYVIGPGDVIEVSVWEATPAMLFGSASSDSRSSPATTRVTTLPEQMVSSDGTINIPFIGHLQVGGHNPQWIEEETARQLRGKANQPQVMVRVIKECHIDRYSCRRGEFEWAHAPDCTWRKIVGCPGNFWRCSSAGKQDDVAADAGKQGSVLALANDHSRSEAEYLVAAGRCDHRTVPAVELHCIGSDGQERGNQFRNSGYLAGTGTGPFWRAQ